MSTTTQTYSYDEVPYPNNPFPQSHPDRLATVATLFGMTPQPVDRCRVLELGCGGGGNLLPMAEQLPASQFVGVELSKVQINAAEQLAERARISNVELKHMNILDVDAQMGQFDYIICHGVFSWVSNAVQNKLLDICAENLSPHGAAYVSYNTYPGWNMRRMIRDMMCYHSRRFDAPNVRVEQARALLDFMAQHTGNCDSYGLFLKSEVETLRTHDDSYLYHEHLEDVNDPIYFYQFAERAQARGLQYLGESDLSSMFTGPFSVEAWTTLENVASNLIQMEQYMDFLRNRTFRQTLLCRHDVSIDREILPSALEALHVASPLISDNSQANILSTEPLDFHDIALGRTVTVVNPLLKAALSCLAEAWPGRIAFPLLFAKCRLRVDQRSVVTVGQLEAQKSGLGTDLLKFYVNNLIELHSLASSFTTEIGRYPKASGVARLQAETGTLVTTLRHARHVLDDFQRHLIRLLDGTRDRPAILNELMKLVDDRVLVVQHIAPKATTEQIRAQIGEALEQALRQLRSAALLIAIPSVEGAPLVDASDVSFVAEASAGPTKNETAATLDEVVVQWDGRWHT